MNRKFLFSCGVAGLTIVSGYSVSISGGVAFGGVALLNNSNPALATSAAIPLAFGALATGSFSPSIGVGTPITFTSPLLDGITSGLLWSGGVGTTFTFSATGPIAFVGGDANSVGIVASGIIDDGPGGLDPTPAEFNMAITKTDSSLGAFGAITIAGDGNSVPDAGGTLTLLGLGSILLSSYRFKLRTR